MDTKLQKLLEKLNLSEESLNLLKDATISKVLVNPSTAEMTLFITLKDYLPLFVYQELQVKKENICHQATKVVFSFSTESTEYSKLIDYFPYVLDSIKNDIMFKSNYFDALKLEDKALYIELTNPDLEEELKRVLPRINELFISFGYPKEITYTIKESTLQEDITKELEKTGEEVTQRQNEKTDEVPIEKSRSNVPFQKNNAFRVPKVKTEEGSVLGRIIIEDEICPIKNLVGEEADVTIEASVFGIEYFESSKSNFKIITLKLTDGTDSIYCKVFAKEDEEYARLKKELKTGSWYRIRGYSKDDIYSKELVLNARDINKVDKPKEERKDTAEEKRIELHAHTMMSQMDGVVEAKALVKQAYKWGHRAIAITDHNGCQAYPDVFHVITDLNKNLEEGKEPFKAIYGTELTMIEDSINIVTRPTDDVLLDQTYVVFDFETTGFNAGGGDSVIEIGAVKLLNGEIIDRYDELVNPGRLLPKKITELTSITDEMLKDCDNEENAMKRFIEWFGTCPMVAHNARFDVSFLEMAYQKYNLGTFKNTVIDTLELSRALDNGYARHGLSAITKRYGITFDEEGHHRGDYDAEATALVFHKMMKKLEAINKEKISDLDNLIEKNEIYKYGRSFHINILVKDKPGLKNLFKIVSMANTIYLHKTPRILRSEISRLREGLLIGSGCYESEVFIEAKSKSDEELSNIMSFYDYIEIQPPECYSHMIESGDFESKEDLLTHLEKIIRVSKEAGKIVVATGDVHHLNREDKVYREIITNQKVPGGGRHPLARYKEIPSNHFRTTDEMLQDFAFLDKELAKEIVITNTNKIADMIDIIEVIIQTGGIPFSPKIDRSVETVTELVYTKASDWYGDPLPHNIEERISKELYGDALMDTLIENGYKDDALYDKLHATILEGFDAVKELIKEKVLKENPELTGKDLEKTIKKKLGGVIGGGFDVIYLIAQKLVKKSNDDGYLVGSRGSVGSSFVATMMGITEVNPLPAHYLCRNCKTSLFEDEEGHPYSKEYSSGYDLPDKVCPKCGSSLGKEGQDMPFATFLGFNADKVPDIDLNFSGDYQWKAHEYTKEVFGVDNVYRAGTIGTVADKTAFGYVRGYFEDRGIENVRTAEIERLALGCTGVKRTTGQHPGGIVVIPGYMDVYDFTPFQYPADDNTSLWRTTHFDYHSIEEDVLKLDILGHDDPTVLRMLHDLSGLDVTALPLSDEKVISLLRKPDALGVTKEQILCPTGTLGLPELGTKFVIQMLVETQPKTFSELVKISGLSHGTDVWAGNASELIKNKVVPFKEVIGCRDDIMVNLINMGMEPKSAFKIMEFVRKGKASKDPETWATHVEKMKAANVPEWYIESCHKIKYMFPKAHAVAYVMSALRIAWFKVYKPLFYYAAYFSVRTTDFDIETMIKGYDAIKDKMLELQAKGFDRTNKEEGIYDSLAVALEATARGITFTNLNLEKSHSKNFVLEGDHTLIPPFRTIDGLGDNVAGQIITEREKQSFISIEDFQQRGHVSKTLIDKLRIMGIFKDMPESNQLSLF